MPIPRKNLISLEETPYYHVFNSCVRDAYLCGENKLTGQNFEHRRQWLLDRIKFLSVSFAIDICAYAILSNHYHLVLKVNKAESMLWSEEQVIQRRTAVYIQAHGKRQYRGVG
jgi:putative transposase